MPNTLEQAREILEEMIEAALDVFCPKEEKHFFRKQMRAAISAAIALSDNAKFVEGMGEATRTLKSGSATFSHNKPGRAPAFDAVDTLKANAEAILSRAGAIEKEGKS